MTKRSRLAKWSLALFAMMVIYSVLISGQPSMADGQLDIGEANVIEVAFIMATAVLVAASWFVGIVTAAKNGQGLWGVGIFFFWPLTYIYLLLVEPRRENAVGQR